jgi:hypothetical protein
MSRRAARPTRSRALWGPCLLGLLAGCAADGSPSGPAAPAPGLAGLPAGATLIGLGGGDLAGVVGEPALVRQEDGAQYRRYRIGGCQLDLFLYTDPASGPARVAHLEVRPQLGAEPAMAEACARLASHLRAAPGPAPPVSAPL